MSRGNQSRFALMPGTRGYKKSAKGTLDKAAREKASLAQLETTPRLAKERTKP
jgi:hypothetical protein